MKRAQKVNGDTLEQTFVDVKGIKVDFASFREDYLEFKNEVRQSITNLQSKAAYANEYFPVEDNEDLERFMSQDKKFECKCILIVSDNLLEVRF